MGSGVAREKVIHNRNGRKVTVYQRQNKQLREEVIRLQKVVAKREQKIAEKAQEEIARLSAELLSWSQKFRDLAARAPGLIEITDVKQRGFLCRLWWALGFVRTGRLRFERS